MQLKESIYRTISFFDLFDFPLTAEEVKTNLFDYEKPVHIKEIEGTLRKIPGIEEIKGFFVLSGHESIVETRKHRKFISEKLWSRTTFYGRHMLKIPFIKMVAVCNNLSYDNASEQSDIDLFVVVKSGRMWTARIWLTLVLHFFGVRRHGNKVAGRFCLSFFVSEKAFNVGRLHIRPADPYLLYWIKTLTPIFGQHTYQEFIDWNQEFINSVHLKFDVDSRKHFFVSDKSLWRSLWEKILGGKLGDLLERFLQRTFKRRTLRKFKSLGPEASVIVNDDMLKFHNHDRRREYAHMWESKVAELMSLPEETKEGSTSEA